MTSRTGAVRVADQAHHHHPRHDEHRYATGTAPIAPTPHDSNAAAPTTCARDLLATLDLPPSADSNRRVLAVLTWLRRGS